MQESKFQFNLTGIGSELGDRRLAVPIYQRSYAWGSVDAKDHVGEYWSDLESTFAKQGEEYFLGTIVLARAPGETQDRDMVIDGQQRLATTAILLAAIRDEFQARGDTSSSDIVQRDFLAKRRLRSTEQVPQLRLNAEDDPFFSRRIVEGSETVEASRESHSLIQGAYTLLRSNVSRVADDAGASWSDRLADWIEFIQSRVQVIAVTVPTESDAFLIFETLNDRGADLTIADLLKNYLFGRTRSQDQLEIVRNAWVSTMAHLELDTSGGKLFTDFLRHYWSSRYGATRERELYSQIKERVSSEAQSVDFGLELERASRLYAAILNSDHELWASLGSVTKAHVDALRTLNLEQHRPLMLAVMQHFPEGELKRSMRAMVSWGVRGLIVGGIGGGRMERVYCRAAMKVRDGAIKTVDELFAELSEDLAGDDQFRRSFAAASIPRSTLARHLLVALEREARGESEPELVPNEDEEMVNLEHVLPKNPSEGDWPEFGAESKRVYIHRLGNMALLQKEKNYRIGNKPFEDKKPILASSDLLWTRDAGAKDAWTPEVVADRQERMAESAVKAWPRDPI